MTIDQSAAAGRMAPPWPSALRGWSAVAVFCVAAVLSYTDRQILSLLVDPIRADLKITDTQIGLLQAWPSPWSIRWPAFLSGGWPTWSRDGL